jgi:hypothetical protein
LLLIFFFFLKNDRCLNLQSKTHFKKNKNKRRSVFPCRHFTAGTLFRCAAPFLRWYATPYKGGNEHSNTVLVALGCWLPGLSELRGWGAGLVFYNIKEKERKKKKILKKKRKKKGKKKTILVLDEVWLVVKKPLWGKDEWACPDECLP